MKRLETERLILRKYELRDESQTFNNLTSDSVTSKYVSWSPHKNIEETKELIDLGIYSITRNDR